MAVCLGSHFGYHELSSLVLTLEINVTLNIISLIAKS